VHAKSTGELISFGLPRSLSPNGKRRDFSADFWSQSEFRTRRKSQQKTSPKSARNDPVNSDVERKGIANELL